MVREYCTTDGRKCLVSIEQEIVTQDTDTGESIRSTMFRFMDQVSINYKSNRMVRPDSQSLKRHLIHAIKNWDTVAQEDESELTACINKEEMKAIRLEQDKENDEEDQAFSAGVLAIEIFIFFKQIKVSKMKSSENTCCK